MLLTCRDYVEKTHEWVMKHHGREFNAANYYMAHGGPINSPGFFKAQGKLNELIELDLFHEIANNTNYAPVIKATFEAMTSRMPTVLDRLGGSSLKRIDPVIGFRPPVTPLRFKSFEAYVAEVNQRAPLVKAKLAELQRELGIPDEIMAGWWYGNLYRLLDGDAEVYLEVRMPKAVTVAHDKLKNKYIELAMMQARSEVK
jgi:hypothetical protein